ncbi:hypothetical protein HYX09_05415 [Candidatus Woesearchaeota archaeon]|nr:hypothetical protein [Candidatus Woesearchaeota archaeon]
MASLISIMLFFVYTWGLGFTFTSFAKKQENFLERHLMNIGIGLGTLISLGLILNLLHIKLYWQIFLIASLAYPVYYAARNYKRIIEGVSKPELKLTKYTLSILLMLLVFLVTFYTYEKGAFAYPYLEDDDSWSHAISTKYVAIEKTLNTPKRQFHYLDPYPPAYSFVTGLMHQTNDSMYWNLKFFNSLIISLGIIFFYFFVRELSGNYNYALFSTFVLASLPSYLSHFIWSLGLSVTLYPIAFYCILKINDSWKWTIPGSLVIAAAFTVSPSHSFYFGLMLGVLLAFKVIIGKKLPVYGLIAALSGLAISGITWWIPQIIKYGFAGMLNEIGIGFNTGNTLLSVDGTGDRVYLLKDFLIAKETNLINSPVGLGLFVSILLFIGILAVFYKIHLSSRQLQGKWRYLASAANLLSFAIFLFGIIRYTSASRPKAEVLMILISLAIISMLIIFLMFKNSWDVNYSWILLALLWFILAFYAVNGVLFPYKVSAFRVWMILSLPVAMLACYGLYSITAIFGRIKFASAFIIIIALTGILFTSFQQKYAVNTAQWPPGGFWTSGEEIMGYLWFKDNILPNTKVFSYSNSGTILGFDKFVCHWCDEVPEFRRNAMNATTDELSGWLKRNMYEYFIIDGQTARRYGVNQTSTMLQGIAASSSFQLAYQTPSFFLFKVN